MAPKRQVDKGKAPMQEETEGQRVTRARTTGIVIREAQTETPRRGRPARQAESVSRAQEEIAYEGLEGPSAEESLRQEEAGQPEAGRGPGGVETVRQDLSRPSGSGGAGGAQGTLQDSAVMGLLLGISQTLQELLQAQRRSAETSVPLPGPMRVEARAVDPAIPAQPEQGLNMKAFQSMKPPIFTSKGDFRAVDAWLGGMEKVFVYMRCPEEHKVPYAVYQLADEAELWWQAERQTLPNEGVNLTWADFKTRFTNYYVPGSERARRVSEFLLLSQGKRTVDEYNAQFRALARFVPWARMDTVETAQKFQDGLRPSIRKNVVPLSLSRYEEILDRARRIEREEENVTMMRDRKRAVWDAEQGHRQRPRTGQEISGLRGLCYICKQPGHRAAKCPQENQRQRPPQGQKRGAGQLAVQTPDSGLQGQLVCYQCGEPGHMKRDCPTLQIRGVDARQPPQGMRGGAPFRGRGRGQFQVPGRQLGEQRLPQIPGRQYREPRPPVAAVVQATNVQEA